MDNSNNTFVDNLVLAFVILVDPLLKLLAGYAFDVDCAVRIVAVDCVERVLCCRKVDS